MDEMKSPKENVQRINDLGLGSTAVKMSRGKGACKGNGEKPTKETGKGLGNLGVIEAKGS